MWCTCVGRCLPAGTEHLNCCMAASATEQRSMFGQLGAALQVCRLAICSWLLHPAGISTDSRTVTLWRFTAKLLQYSRIGSHHAATVNTDFDGRNRLIAGFPALVADASHHVSALCSCLVYPVPFVLDNVVLVLALAQPNAAHCCRVGWHVHLRVMCCHLPAELLLRRPWLPGNSDIDQLGKVFQALGTPTKDSWPGASHRFDQSGAFHMLIHQTLAG